MDLLGNGFVEMVNASCFHAANWDGQDQNWFEVLYISVECVSRVQRVVFELVDDLPAQRVVFKLVVDLPAG